MAAKKKAATKKVATTTTSSLVQNVIKLIQDNEIKYADLRFCDTRGKEQHVTIPARYINEDFFR